MPERPETDPIPAHVDAVVAQVLQPQLATLAHELRHPLRVHVHLLKDGERVGSAALVDTSATPGSAHVGEARLRFRPTHFPSRRLFFLDAVFPSHPGTPAFSGFFVRGRIEEGASGVVAHFSTWSVKRNDPQWRLWL